MQHPTHTSLYIRNEHDAHVVMEAVRLGRLPMITHRLSTHERLSYIQPGTVFVWEEAESRGVGGKGMERWTDGLKWSPSRSNDPFLLYEERAEHLVSEEIHGGADDPTAGSYTYRRSTRPDKPDGLTKKTYSAFVHDPAAPPGSKPSKWHITSYFRRPEHKYIPTIDAYPYLRGIEVTPGTFVAAKTLRRRRRSAGSLEPEDQEEDRFDSSSPMSASTHRPPYVDSSGSWPNSAVSSRQSTFSPPPFQRSHPSAPAALGNGPGNGPPPQSYYSYSNVRSQPHPQGQYLPPYEYDRHLPSPIIPSAAASRPTTLPPFQELTRHLPPVFLPPAPRLPVPTSAVRTSSWDQQASR